MKNLSSYSININNVESHIYGTIRVESGSFTATMFIDGNQKDMALSKGRIARYAERLTDIASDYINCDMDTTPEAYITTSMRDLSGLLQCIHIAIDYFDDASGKYRDIGSDERAEMYFLLGDVISRKAVTATSFEAFYR